MADATVSGEQREFGRGKPAAIMVGALIAYGLHHAYTVVQGEGLLTLALLFPMVAGWGLGGLLYPPAFHSLTVPGRHLPTRDKVYGTLFGLAGFSVGFWAALVLYRPTWWRGP